MKTRTTHRLARLLTAAALAAVPLAAPAQRIVNRNVAFARAQLDRAIAASEESGRFRNPITLDPTGKVVYGGYSDWRAGFFPGTVWYLYELTGDGRYLPPAERYTRAVERAKRLTWHHDIGFIVECSFGNAYRLTGREEYAEVIVEAARSLATRFRPAAGVIQSWDVDGESWQARRGWKCPVIIDNMMNLELLFHATELSGDSTYYRIACAHADRTLREHFRPDGSCYHVIDYDPQEGRVLHRHTAQGYAHESVWSRGQAWAVYGFTVCYRATGDRRYLEQARRTFRFMKEHPRMPKDGIPYWDMDAPDIPDTWRDASSAACLASALYELCVLDKPHTREYRTYADRILRSLGSRAYRAPLGSNGCFLLLHSVGSVPHGSEIDVPLNYADYYFMEALKRRRDL